MVRNSVRPFEHNFEVPERELGNQTSDAASDSWIYKTARGRQTNAVAAKATFKVHISIPLAIQYRNNIEGVWFLQGLHRASQQSLRANKSLMSQEHQRR